MTSLPPEPGQERWHGTASGYTSHVCRCPACTEAHAADARRYLARQRQLREEERLARAEPR